MSEIISSGGNEQAHPEPLQPTISTPSASATVDWDAIEQSSDFRQLIRSKRNFILPAVIIFLVYYFGFLILVGYFPSTVDVNVIGNINVAYLFALSQFILAWILVFLYVRRAATFDKMAESIVSKVKGQ